MGGRITGPAPNVGEERKSKKGKKGKERRVSEYSDENRRTRKQ